MADNTGGSGDKPIDDKGSLIHPGMSPEQIASHLESIRLIESAYTSFSKVLSEKGPEAAIQYARSINKLSEDVVTFGKVAKDTTLLQETLNNSTSNYAQVINAIKMAMNDNMRVLSQYATRLKEIDELKQKEIKNNDISKQQFEQAERNLNKYTSDINKNLDNLKENSKAKEKFLELIEKEEKLYAARSQKFEKSGDDKKDEERKKQRRQEIEDLIKERDRIAKELEQTGGSSSLIKSTSKYFFELSKYSKNGSGIGSIIADQNLLQIQILKTTAEYKKLEESLPTAVTGEKYAAGVQKINKSFGNLIDNLTGATHKSGELAGLFMSFGNVSNFFKTFVSSFMDVEKAVARVGNVIDKFLIQPTFEYNKLIAETNKATGGLGKEFEKMAFKSTTVFGMDAKELSMRGLSEYGIGVRELSKSYIALSQEIMNFNDLSDSQKGYLSANAAAMENLGISGQTYGRLVNTFVSSISTTVQGATELVNKLAEDAIRAGKNVGQYMEEFSRLLPDLAAYGEQADDIFAKINNISKQSKISSSEIFKISEGLTDFQKNVKLAGTLRAIMPGTSIDPLALIGDASTTPEERFLKLLEGMQRGKENLTPRQIQLISKELGVTSQTLQQMLKLDISTLETISTLEQDALQKRQKDSVDAMKRLETTINNIKLSLTPLINLLNGVSKGIENIANKFGPTGVVLTAIGVFSGAAFIAFKGFFAGLNKMLDQFFIRFDEHMTKVLEKTNLLKLEANTPLSSTGSAASAAESAGKLGKLGKFGKFAGKFGRGFAILGIAQTAASMLSNYGKSDESLSGMVKPSEDFSSMADLNTPVDENNIAPGIGINQAAGFNPKRGIFDPQINDLIQNQKSLVYLQPGKSPSISLLDPTDNPTALFTNDEESRDIDNSTKNINIIAPNVQSGNQQSVTATSIKNDATKEFMEYNSSYTNTQTSERILEKSAEYIGKEVAVALQNIFKNQLQIDLKAEFPGLAIGETEGRKFKADVKESVMLALSSKLG